MPASPQPFRIALEQALLEDLGERIRRTRWPDSIEGSGWSYGTDAAYLRELSAYWADGFDWRRQERLLNEQLPGWIVELDGRRVHYARVAGKGPKPLALVLLHGWPGSFMEFAKLAPLLADPGAHGADPADAFDLVIPSLPGHGFSPAVLEPGFGADECADLVHRLMTEVLGIARFGAQGGDRGAFVSMGLGHRHARAMIGIHLNFPTGIAAAAAEQSDEERVWLAAQMRWFAEEGGYIAIQGSKPQTIGFGLNDSPVGLLAWIVEKWRGWSDCGGEVERCFTRDELLVNATLYWATQTIRASMHYYYEHRTRPPVATRPERIEVPTGVAAFPKEVVRTPRVAAERKYADLRRWTEMPAGGHFAALEQPQALAEEIRAFFRPLRG
jgi:pimeloyl-ACP methyl ester carboxylesterase